MSKILYLTKGFIHPSNRMQQVIYSLLSSFGYDVLKTNKFSACDNNYIWVIAFFHEKNISLKELESLQTYVNNGGHLLLIHGSLASYKKSKQYTQLIGSTFVSHSKISPINVYKNDKMIGLVNDELYLFSFNQPPVILYMGKTSENTSPICWEKTVGKGKIISFSLGHKLQSIKSDLFKSILKDLLERKYENK